MEGNEDYLQQQQQQQVQIEEDDLPRVRVPRWRREKRKVGNVEVMRWVRVSEEEQAAYLEAERVRLSTLRAKKAHAYTLAGRGAPDGAPDGAPEGGLRELRTKSETEEKSSSKELPDGASDSRSSAKDSVLDGRSSPSREDEVAPRDGDSDAQAHNQEEGKE